MNITPAAAARRHVRVFVRVLQLGALRVELQAALLGLLVQLELLLIIGTDVGDLELLAERCRSGADDHTIARSHARGGASEDRRQRRRCPTLGTHL